MRKTNGKIKSGKALKQTRRKLSIRKKVEGCASRPRICVNQTNKHLRVQVIDDLTGQTLVSAGTFGKSAVGCKSKAGAGKLGEFIASGMKSKGISAAVFDRNGRPYGGVLASLADSIRGQGIKL